MPGINPIAIGTGDPEFYAELLRKTTRLANPRLPSVDGSLTQCQSLLNAVADISLCQRGNVSATMACVKDNGGILETQLYVVFNHQDDEAARSCPPHLESIFRMLHQIPCEPTAMDSSSEAVPTEVVDNFVEIVRAIHNHSFEIFAHRVTKHEPKLLYIRKCIEQDQKYFKPKHRSTLVEFLEEVDIIIKMVADARATKQLPIISIQKLLGIFSTWTTCNLLPKDKFADSKATLLDKADRWLAKELHMGFKLQHWAQKIMSFVISATWLFTLTQSPLHRTLLDGKFSVQVLPSPTTTPYRCNLSPEAIKEALDTALDGTIFSAAEWNEEHKSFIEQLLEEPEASEVVVWKPTVHAELAMILAMVKGEIKHIFPNIGVSKHSCMMCSCYVRAFNEVTRQKISTKGSHGKAYPGWFWPSLPDHDEELRPTFLEHMRRQLLGDFEKHVTSLNLLSSSGSEC